MTIFQTFSPVEAQLIRSRLEAADFQAFVTHELAALCLDGYSLAVGGVLVQVPEPEAEAARALLEAADSSPT